MMNQSLSSDYQEQVLARWDKVLESGKPIKSEAARVATALVLENTQREFQKKGMLNEAVLGMGAGPGNTATGAYNAPAGGGALGSTTDYGVCDSRIPTIVVPTLRRIFPELVAHDLVGVQPMGGPVGFAYALRFQYGVNGQGGVDGAAQGTEMGYNTVDGQFTGASGLVELDESGNYCQPVPGLGTTSLTGDAWAAFAGAGNALSNGQGAGMQDAEWWAIGDDMPTTQFRLEKGVVEAKTRKLAAHWSLELAEDMMNMHGVDVDAEMVNVMSYEVQAEIDRQILGEMVKAAIVGGKVSDWSPVSADGRHQMERIGTIYTETLVKSQAIAIATRRGPATFAVASPTVVALLERLGDFTSDTASVEAQHASVGISKVGQMRNGGIGLYRDTFAGGDYILLGYKGPTAYDSGIVYCPYIPLQLNSATGQEDFSPRVGVRTRYGVLANLFGSANYYHFIKIGGLQGSALAADGSRVFLY
jgi:hypothetical protein